MGFLSNIKGVIYKLDFFYTAQLLRYREEPEYRTLFGGVLSTSIIILLLVTFYNRVVDTFDKVIINSSFSSTSADDPVPYTISTMPGKPFMFGVEIWHHDLNANPRYFDINFLHAHLDTGEYNNNSLDIPLEPCTREHWSEYPAILEGFDRLNIAFWLCLPKNLDLPIQGKYSSVISKTLQISISRCSNSTSFTHPCATDTQIDALFAAEGNFYYTLYFINPLINSDSPEFLSHYLEDANYIMFSATDGEECQLMVEDYTITTDESIIPLSAENVESGGIITSTCIKNRYTNDAADPSPLYATFYFYKSPISIEIDRSFQKIDEILSYIGGLFGTIAICLFFVNLFNSYSFEILIGGYLFKPDDQQMGKQLKKYQFLHFLLHIFYLVVNLFGCNCSCPTTKLYYDCREQMVKQLDILYLLRRVTFLERAVSNVLTPKQLRALHFIENKSLAEAKKDRKRFKWNDQSFIYRYLDKTASQGPSSSSGLRQKKVGASDSNPSQQPHLVTGSGITNEVANTFNQNNASCQAFKVALSQQHQLSSDDESEDEDTEDIRRELIGLKNEAEHSSTSLKIWESLNPNVRDIVENSHPNEHRKGDAGMVNQKQTKIFAAELDGDSFDLSIKKKIERKPKMRRFKQLPTLTFPEGVKVNNHWQQKLMDDSYDENKAAKIDDEYIQMEDFSPEKKE